MSGATSFLFQGSPVPPQPTGSDTSTSYPLWLQQFVANTANAATNLANQPYTPFPGQQVASPSNDTRQSWNLAENSVNNFAPYLNQAGTLTNSAAAPVGFSPLTGSDISQYMNPYNQQVIGALQSAANTNLFQDVLPKVESQFVSAGQSRSPQEMQATNNAVYQSNQALDQAVGQALNTGYQGALQTAQGQQAAGLQTAEANRSAALAAGAQSGQLGALQQQLTSANIGQLAAAGQGQDITNQANINAGLNNFYSQQQWPYQNLAYASNIIRGQPVPSNTQTVGLQYNPSAAYSPSPLASFVGTTLGASALGNNSAGGLRQGGSVSGALERAGERLRQRGRGHDTILAHINQPEAAMLRAAGGSGRRNPRTGLPEFDSGNPVADQSQTSGIGPGLTSIGGGRQAAYGNAASPYELWSQAPPDFSPLAKDAAAPSFVTSAGPGALNSIAYAYPAAGSQDAGGYTSPGAPTGSAQLGTWSLNGQTNYGYNMPGFGFAAINHPTSIASGNQNTLNYGPALAGQPAVGGSNVVPAGAQEWNIDPTTGIATPTAPAAQEASITQGRENDNLGLMFGLSALGTLAGGALAAGALGGGAAGAAALSPEETAAALASDLPSAGAGAATGTAPGIFGAAAAPAVAAAPSVTGGALSSLWNSPALQGIKAATSIGRLASSLGNTASVAGQQAAAPAIAQQVIPQSVFSGAINPAFSAVAPSHSFYARRGGRVPGALMRARRTA